MSLSLVSSKSIRQVLPASEVLKMYAEYLESESWCIDSSRQTVMAFQAKSGYPANLDHFKNTFPAWSKRENVRVRKDEYDSFLLSLRNKLPTMLHSILGSTMRPVPAKFISVHGATFANTYVPYHPPRPVDCSASLAEQLFNRLFPDKVERKWCLQFLAHIFQKPLERPQHALLITGKGATCKSSLMRLVRSALNGRHFYSKNDYTQALQKFSEVIQDNLVIVIDDAVAAKDTYENLKDTITRDHQMVELKGTQKLVSREVYSRIIVVSNLIRPLRLVDDRRFFPPAYIEHLVDKKNSEEFGLSLHNWLMEPATSAILYHWFMDVDLTGFTVGSCPRTETLTQMEGASTPALERHICSFIEDNTINGVLPIFHEREIADYLEHVGLKAITLDGIASKLSAQGYEHKKRRRPLTAKEEGEGKDADAAKFVYMWQPVLPKGSRSRNLTSVEITELARHLGLEF